jgi:hypothetical protein
MVRVSTAKPQTLLGVSEPLTAKPITHLNQAGSTDPPYRYKLILYLLIIDQPPGILICID